MTVTQADILDWTVRVPLLTNRIIRRQMLWWASMTSLLCGLIFGGILISQEGLDAVSTALIIMAAIFVGVLSLAVLVMGLFFFNRMTLRFHVDDNGIRMATGDAKVRAANTAAIVLGVIAGKPGAVGAGLIGHSQERDSVAWNELRRWEALPDLRAVAAYRGFPGPLYIYATAEMYQPLLNRLAVMHPAKPL